MDYFRSSYPVFASSTDSHYREQIPVDDGTRQQVEGSLSALCRFRFVRFEQILSKGLNRYVCAKGSLVAMVA